MSLNPESFLIGEHAPAVAGADGVFSAGTAEAKTAICTLNHLAVLAVTGSQAGAFLQGQMTCSIADVHETKASFGAFCTAQGKVISTFLLVKCTAGYHLVMPEVLLATVTGHLQKYILRADVQLTGCQDSVCVLGVFDTTHESQPLFSCQSSPLVSIAFGQRHMVLLEQAQADDFFKEKVQKRGFVAVHSSRWRYQDIIDGLPWLAAETTGQFIPHMLNLDKLGGISFNKGCYTGQEVVARTHYLGKAKRGLAVFGIDPPVQPFAHSVLVDSQGQAAGRVLNAVQYHDSARLLCVLSHAVLDPDLNLPDFPHHTLTRID